MPDQPPGDRAAILACLARSLRRYVLYAPCGCSRSRPCTAGNDASAAQARQLRAIAVIQRRSGLIRKMRWVALAHDIQAPSWLLSDKPATSAVQPSYQLGIHARLPAQTLSEFIDFTPG